MTYYLKYRSRNFDEIDIETVRETLIRLFSIKSYPHVLLFAGPKGTGKTSAARIVAKVINCTNIRKNGDPCDKCDQCISISKGTNIDVYELDAASHRGIDDIRVLRDGVKLAPIAATKKVYIIDEAHMLTTEASNAFLKTLEEPPEHVLFIFATTNPEKLIDTIRSRTTLVNFKKASVDEIIRSLKRVVKAEGLKVDTDALSVIAMRSDGSFRDAVKFLEQAASNKRKVTTKNVDKLLEGSQSFDIDKFLSFMADRDVKGALRMIKQSSDAGIDPKNMYTKSIDRLRSALLSRNGLSPHDIDSFTTSELIELVDILNGAYSKMGSSYIETIPLEIAIVRWCESESDHSSSVIDVKKKSTKEIKNDEVTDDKKTVSVKETLEDIDEKIWNQIREKVSTVNFALDALLRAAKPLGSTGDKIKLGVYYTFHKEHLERDGNRRALEDVISDVFGRRIAVDCVLCQPDENITRSAGITLREPNGSLTEDDKTDIIKAAREIFG